MIFLLEIALGTQVVPGRQERDRDRERRTQTETQRDRQRQTQTQGENKKAEAISSFDFIFLYTNLPHQISFEFYINSFDGGGKKDT